MSERNVDAAKLALVREGAATVVNSLYRLIKACQFHAGTNEAVIASATRAAEAVAAYCSAARVDAVTLVFLGDAVFVNGQILKTSRETHALAIELGQMLEHCNVSELTISNTVGPTETSKFARTLTDLSRDAEQAKNLAAHTPPGFTASRAKAFAGAGLERDDSPGARVARTYAVANVTVQEMLVALGEGKFALPPKIKRVAQKLVTHAEEDARMLVALAALGRGAGDLAGVAVGSAILAVAMARQLSQDRVLLANVAMAALMFDVGRFREGGGGGALARMLNDDELDRLPPSSAVMMTVLGKLQSAARTRTAIVYEAWALRRAHRLGAPYKGRRTPTVLSRILVTARAFAELRAASVDASLTIDDAIQVLMKRAENATERTFVKLLVGALGIYPAGTMVELNTGELGVVMATPAMPVDFVRPPVKILYDEDTNLLDEPIDVDLAAPRTDGGPMRFVKKSINADDQQMQAMRSFVVAATASTRRGALPADAAPASVEPSRPSRPNAPEPAASPPSGSGHAFSPPPRQVAPARAPSAPAFQMDEPVFDAPVEFDDVDVEASPAGAAPAFAPASNGFDFPDLPPLDAPTGDDAPEAEEEEEEEEELAPPPIPDDPRAHNETVRPAKPAPAVAPAPVPAAASVAKQSTVRDRFPGAPVSRVDSAPPVREEVVATKPIVAPGAPLSSRGAAGPPSSPSRSSPGKDVARGSQVSAQRPVGRPISRNDSSPPSSEREEVFGKPPPASMREPLSSRRNLGAPISRNDSAPPSGQADVIGRGVAIPVAPPSQSRPLAPTAPPPSRTTTAQAPKGETPKSPSVAQQSVARRRDPDDEPSRPALGGANATRQVNWESYGKLVHERDKEAQQQDQHEATASSEAERPPPSSAHDDLLAAFLSEDDPPAAKAK